MDKYSQHGYTMKQPWAQENSLTCTSTSPTTSVHHGRYVTEPFLHILSQNGGRYVPNLTFCFGFFFLGGAIFQLFFILLDFFLGFLCKGGHYIGSKMSDLVGLMSFGNWNLLFIIF